MTGWNGAEVQHAVRPAVSYEALDFVDGYMKRVSDRFQERKSSLQTTGFDRSLKKEIRLWEEMSASRCQVTLLSLR